MSPERSRVIWITVAITAFILVVSIAGVFLFYPRNQAASAPATIGNVAVPKAADPQDYLATPPATPDQSTSRKGNGDIVVIYGDKPTNLPPLGTGQQGGPSPAGAQAQGTQYNPDGSIMGQVPQDSASSASANASGSASATATATATATVTPKVPPVAKSVAKAGPPAAKVETKAASAKKPATEEYWIQAASFTERSKADNLREALAEKGLAALITVKDISGKSWYRVRIGPYSAKSEADGWVTRVKSVNGCSEAWVSVEKPKAKP
jgi:DedD protein